MMQKTFFNMQYPCPPMTSGTQQMNDIFRACTCQTASHVEEPSLTLPLQPNHNNEFTVSQVKCEKCEEIPPISYK